MQINNDFIIEQKFNQGDTIYIIDLSVAKFYIFDEYFFDDKKKQWRISALCVRTREFKSLSIYRCHAIPLTRRVLFEKTYVI